MVSIKNDNSKNSILGLLFSILLHFEATQENHNVFHRVIPKLFPKYYNEMHYVYHVRDVTEFRT